MELQSIQELTNELTECTPQYRQDPQLSGKSVWSSIVIQLSHRLFLYKHQQCNLYIHYAILSNLNISGFLYLHFFSTTLPQLANYIKLKNNKIIFKETNQHFNKFLFFIEKLIHI